jgi:hypothetical protein
MAALRTRAFQEGDQSGILALYREVFGLELSLDAWRWLYQQMPHGPAVITVAEQAGEIVGHYAIQPRPFVLGDRPGVAGLAIGTMIAPKARNVTVLVDLAQAAYALCRQRGISLLYAFPNEQAWRVRRALLNWQALPPRVEWQGNVSTGNNATGSSATGGNAEPSHAADLLHVACRADRADVMLGRGLPHGPHLPSGEDRIIAGQRDAGWLRWRFFENPLSEYTFHGLGADSDHGAWQAYAVTKLYRREDGLWGHLIDWGCEPNRAGAAQRLLDGVLKCLAQQGAEWFSCWAPDGNLSQSGDAPPSHAAEGSDVSLRGGTSGPTGEAPCGWLAAALQQRGFARTGRETRFCYLALDDSIPADSMPGELMPDETERPLNWQMMMADSDVY